VDSERVASAPPVAPQPAPEVSNRVAPQPAASADRDSGIPYWDDMSLEFRSELPMPRLDVHVYDSNPQRRFLLVELKKYREGDTLTNGAVVEEILPDGVQLFYRGTRFVYRK
jgi:general secretion pathway protein B